MPKEKRRLEYRKIFHHYSLFFGDAVGVIGGVLLSGVRMHNVVEVSELCSRHGIGVIIKVLRTILARAGRYLAGKILERT